MTTFVFSNNGNTTLASNASSSATTLTVSTGAGALFPNPSAGQQFTLTLNDALTGDVYEICYCTARSGDTLTVLRAQEGTTAVSWLAGDLAFNGPTAGTLNALGQAAGNNRTSLTGATTFYVATTGSDSNNGLTSGTAWLTIQHAINTLIAEYDLAGFAATILCATGAYNAPISVSQAFTGGGSVTLQGNPSTPTDCTITVTGSNDCVTAAGGGIITLTGFSFTSGRSCLQAYTGGVIMFGNCQFNAATVAHQHSNGGYISNNTEPYTIAGNAEYHALSLGSGANVNLGIGTITLSGTPAFSSAFLYATDAAAVLTDGFAITGAGTGPGWLATFNGVIDTDGTSGEITGAGFSAGSTASGGQFNP